jgi:predicted peptidase
MPARRNTKSPRKADRQRLAGLDTKICFAEFGKNLIRPYRLFIPRSYQWAPKKPGGKVKKFPLAVMLHGGGSLEYPCDENWFFANKETPDRVQTFAEERGYIIACPTLAHVTIKRGGPDFKEQYRKFSRENDPPFINALIKDVTYNMHIDESRVYLCGASRGGLAMYHTLIRHPARCAAAAAVCSHPMDTRRLKTIAGTPVLILHATDDQIIPIEKARKLKDGLAALGCDVKMKEFPGAHDGLRNNNAFKEIFDWFDAHRREQLAAEERE